LANKKGVKAVSGFYGGFFLPFLLDMV